MNPKERNDLIEHRISRAKSSIKEVELLVENELFKATISRLYYACIGLYFMITGCIRADINMIEENSKINLPTKHEIIAKNVEGTKITNRYAVNIELNFHEHEFLLLVEQIDSLIKTNKKWKYGKNSFIFSNSIDDDEAETIILDTLTRNLTYYRLKLK